MDLNVFSFTGRLGADAAVKQLPSGKYVMELSVAVGTGYGDYKKTLWIKVKVWGDRVNNISSIFTKGSLITGSGELSTEEWQGKDGVMHTTVVVTCLNVQLLHKKDDTKASNDQQQMDFEGDIPF